MRPKSKDERRHTLRRLRERLGMALSEEEYLNIIRRIQNGEAKFLEKQSNRVSVFELSVRDEQVAVCYDKDRKELITAFPADWQRRQVRFI